MLEFIEDILIERDQYKYGSLEWHNLNYQKAMNLEDLKSSWVEKVAYFLDSELKDISDGFTKTNILPSAKIYEDSRSMTEYNNGYTRQIIPYCLIKCNDEYYFISRENNGDDRINSKLGLAGGHTDKDITLGALRELEEEAGITPEIIKNMELIGIVKTDGSSDDEYDISKDHIGLVYLVELKTKNIRMQELGVQKAFFVRQEDFHKYQHRFEDWLDIVVRNLFHS